MAEEKNDKKQAEEKAAPKAAAVQPMPNGDVITLPEGAAKTGMIALGVGLVLIGGAYALAGGWEQFIHSYLTAFMWGLAVSVGGVWWVMIQHLMGARASVVMRRIGEIIAQGSIIMGVLALPIIGSAVMGDDTLYTWVNSEYMHSTHMLESKIAYLNTNFFLVRMVFYFGFWALMSVFWLKKSIAQDSTSGDVALMRKLQGNAAPGLIGFTIAVTFCAIDLLMSMDAYWFSTIFGVYYFATCVIMFHSFLALAIMWMQGKGVLAKSINQEHFHDVGKMMFAFTCFWAYVGFSQFMLIWYANIPEESHWYYERFQGNWLNLSLFLGAAHFLIPFFGMISRSMKRNRKTLAFWAFYLITMCWIDMYWLVAPNIHKDFSFPGGADFLAWFGMAGVVFGFFIIRANGKNLVATGDPRLKRSLAFQNI